MDDPCHDDRASNLPIICSASCNDVPVARRAFLPRRAITVTSTGLTQELPITKCDSRVCPDMKTMRLRFRQRHSEKIMTIYQDRTRHCMTFRKVVSASVFAMLIGTEAVAADIVNGMSERTTITGIRSYFSFTDFILNSSVGGCGTPDGESIWRLPLTSSDASRFKRAMLLGAYLAGKKVTLRCENSVVTDFFVAD